MQYKNPILPGFHPDPSICRVGDDFYLAIADGSQTKQFNITKDGVFSVTTTISGNPTRLICMLYKTGATGNLVEATIEYMKLELGEVATNFSSRVYAEEFAFCQRYCVVNNDHNYNYNDFGFGVASSSSQIDIKTSIPATLRTLPTIFFSLGGQPGTLITGLFVIL